MSGSNVLRLANDAMMLNRETLLKGVLIGDATAPETPPENSVFLYVDAADGDLKAKNDQGQVVVVANFT